MRVAAIALVLLVAGCAPGAVGHSPFTSAMTPEQITELVKDKSAGITCVAGTYAGARVVIVAVNADKGVPTFMEVTDDCKLKMGPPPPAPR